MQLMTFEDMTYELQRTNRRLETAQHDLRQIVITDALTGTRNRRFFDEVIGRELQRHRRYKTPLSIVFIDVDRFKTINDTLGHETGDRVLRDVAAFLLQEHPRGGLRVPLGRRRVPGADLVRRAGGDAPRGATLQQAFARSPQLADLPPGVGAQHRLRRSPGRTPTDIMPLVQTADERMYVDKKRRRRRGSRSEVTKREVRGSNGPWPSLDLTDTAGTSPAAAASAPRRRPRTRRSPRDRRRP